MFSTKGPLISSCSVGRQQRSDWYRTSHLQSICHLLIAEILQRLYIHIHTGSTRVLTAFIRAVTIPNLSRKLVFVAWFIPSNFVFTLFLVIELIFACSNFRLIGRRVVPISSFVWSLESEFRLHLYTNLHGGMTWQLPGKLWTFYFPRKWQLILEV